MFKRPSVRLLLTLTIAALLLYYTLRTVSWAAVGQEFNRVDYKWVGLVTLGTIGSYVVRGKRSQQSLMALGYAPSTFRSTIALMSGNIASMLVPGAGEVTRCLTLSRTDRIPLMHVMGAVVSERVVDLLMLLVVMALTVGLEFGRISRLVGTLPLVSGAAVGWAMGGAVAVAVVGGLLYWRFGRSWATYPLAGRIRNGLLGLWQGFAAIRSLPNPRLFVGLAVLNQLIYFANTYWLLRTLPDTQALPPTVALLILTVASVGGLAVPTQGGIGTYHFMVGNALMLYGVSQPQGAVMATLMHAVGFVINVVLSAISFLIVPFLVSQRTQPTPPAPRPDPRSVANSD